MFNRFSSAIKALPGYPDVDREAALSGSLRIASEGMIAMHYAPFEFVNADARIVLLGITPGWTQMCQALTTARAALVRGAQDESIMREAKIAASFSGPMRAALITTLNAIGVHLALGLASSVELFAGRGDLIHLTSALRYPTFVDRENYNGKSSAIDKSSMLRQMVESVLLPELLSVPRSLVIPLGKPPFEVMESLIRRGSFPASRCISEPVVHPSGAANGYRAAFLRDRAADIAVELLAKLGTA